MPKRVTLGTTMSLTTFYTSHIQGTDRSMRDIISSQTDLRTEVKLSGLRAWLCTAEMRIRRP